MKKKHGVFFGMTIFIPAAVFTLAGCWLLNKGQDDVSLFLPPPNPAVTGVTVSPNSTDVAKGGTKTFTAQVAGINSPAQTVTWAVSGNAEAGTAISSAGVLTVNSNEAGGTTLTITATSAADASKSGMATVTVEYAIGDAGPAGGIIFYVDSADTYPLWKYLEAAPADLGTREWVAYGTTYASTLIGGTAQAIGTGKDNTVAILAAADTDAPAAKACDDYTYGGFDDWFLPSFDELYEMYLNRTAIGGFSSAWYWSSSEDTPALALAQYFGIDNLSGSLKYQTYRVRPIRAF